VKCERFHWKWNTWVLAWLSVWSEVQTCIWPSWCHCHSLSLASAKFQIGFTILVPAHPGSPGQRVVKRVCVLNWRSVPFSSSAVNPALCPIHTEQKLASASCRVVWIGRLYWTRLDFRFSVCDSLEVSRIRFAQPTRPKQFCRVWSSGGVWIIATKGSFIARVNWTELQLADRSAVLLKTRVQNLSSVQFMCCKRGLTPTLQCSRQSNSHYTDAVNCV